MAKLYSKSRGKAGSHKPMDKTVPSWVTYKPAEVEQLIVKLAKQEKGSSLIGIILRDSYGIPSVKALLGKTIMQVIKKNIAEMKHMESNKHDMVAHRGVQLTESKIKRLATYYKAKKVLHENWTYDRTQAKLYLE